MSLNNKIENLKEYVMSKITINNNGCWEYQGTKNAKGYGMVEHMGRGHRVHRLMWQLTHGDIPADKQINHKCDNRICCNPEHLYAGTQIENVHDRQVRGRWRPNNQRGEDIGTSKLNEQQVIEIRSKYIPRKYSFYKLAKDKEGNGGALIRFLPDSEKGMMKDNLFRWHAPFCGAQAKKRKSIFAIPL